MCNNTKDIFNLQELISIKTALNEMISSRWVYINSPTTTNKESSFNKQKLTVEYDLLKKVVELIDKEESK